MKESYSVGILVHPHDQPLIRLYDMTSTRLDPQEALCPFIVLEVYNKAHQFPFIPFHSYIAALWGLPLLYDVSLFVFPTTL